MFAALDLGLWSGTSKLREVELHLRANAARAKEA